MEKLLYLLRPIAKLNSPIGERSDARRRDAIMTPPEAPHTAPPRDVRSATPSFMELFGFAPAYSPSLPLLRLLLRVGRRTYFCFFLY